MSFWLLSRPNKTSLTSVHDFLKHTQGSTGVQRELALRLVGFENSKGMHISHSKAPAGMLQPTKENSCLLNLNWFFIF